MRKLKRQHADEQDTQDVQPGVGMPPRLYSYRRCSKPSQAKGRSFKRQAAAPQKDDKEGTMAKWLARVVEEEKAVLNTTEQFDDKGMSSFRGRNATVGRLGEFLRRVEARLIPRGSILAFENLDRMSRSALPKAMKIFIGLLEAGIVVRTYRPDRRYTYESVCDLGGIIEPLVEMVRANEESARKSRLLKDMWEAKREEAAPGTACARGPDWTVRLTRQNEEGEEVPVGYALKPGVEAILHQVRDWVLDGVGLKQIAKRLAADPERYPPFSRAGRWQPEYLHKIVRGRQSLGEYQPHTWAEKPGPGGEPTLVRVPAGKPIQGYYPAVFTEEEWKDMQLALDGRRDRPLGRRGKGDPNLFTGLAFEAGSGRAYASERSLHRREGAAAWNSRYLGTQPEEGVRRQLVPYDDAEAAIRDAIQDLTPVEVVPANESPGPLHERIAALTKRLLGLERNLVAVRTQVEDPTISEEELAEAVASQRRLVRDKTDTAKELARAQEEARSGGAEELAEVQDLWQQEREASPEKRQALRSRLKARLADLIEGIWIAVQPVNHLSKILHIKIYVRGGAVRYVRTATGPARRRPETLRPWDFTEVDLRSWDGRAGTGGK